LGFQPRCDGEVPPGRHQPLGRVFCLVSLTFLPIGNHKLDKAKTWIAGIVGLESGTRFVNMPRQTARISKNAKIDGRMVLGSARSIFGQDHRLLGKSRWREYEAGLI
jgi:hypothetical protein